MRRKNLWNVLFLFVSQMIGYALILSWSTQQLDLMLSPLVYQYRLGEPWWLPFGLGGFTWYATKWAFEDAYVRFLMLVHIGYWVGVICEFIALWFWEDS